MLGFDEPNTNGLHLLLDERKQTNGAGSNTSYKSTSCQMTDGMICSLTSTITFPTLPLCIYFTLSQPTTACHFSLPVVRPALLWTPLPISPCVSIGNIDLEITVSLEIKYCRKVTVTQSVLQES
jgi:hypothetical protein